MRARSVLTPVFAMLLAVAMIAGCSKGPSARADADVAADVQTKLNNDANLTSKGITVNSNGGTVTLSGAVANETERLSAANDAGQVDGVKTVVNNLTVGGASASTDMPSNTTPSNVRPAAPAASTSRSQRATVTPAQRSGQATPSTGMNAAPAAPAPEPKVTVPSGTELSVRTNDEIHSEKAAVGDSFTATLDSPVYVGEAIAIPAHAEVRGNVVDVKSAGKFAGRSEMVLQLTNVSYNGRSYPITSSKWQKYGASRGKNTAAKVGGGAAIGAVIGGIAGGGKGAAIGAGIGAGAGTGVQAVTKSEQIVLRPETVLTFTLENPVSVVASASNNSSTRKPMTNNQ
jgi:hypothetical protein